MKVFFLADRWVKFQYDNKICIGVTFLEETNNSNIQIQLVFFITKELETEIIEFSECVDLRYLDFVKKPNNNKELEIKNEMLTLETQIDLVLRPKISKNTIYTLAIFQCNTIYAN